MMLFVENTEKGGSLELAMLLDESPSPEYGNRAYSNLEPWTQGGSLATATAEARTCGRATLYLVFQSDDCRSWGSRTVLAVAGGLLFNPLQPKTPLRYEFVNRELFGNICGSQSTQSYRVLSNVSLGCDLDSKAGKISKVDPHRCLGFRDLQTGSFKAGVRPSENTESKCSPFELGDTPELRTGTYVSWVDQSGYSEHWFVADVTGFFEFRFEMQEFARRRFVRVVLSFLGFVSSPLALSTEIANRNAAGALLNGLLPQCLAIQNLCCSALSPGSSLVAVKGESTVACPDGRDTTAVTRKAAVVANGTAPATPNGAYQTDAAKLTRNARKNGKGPALKRRKVGSGEPLERNAPADGERCSGQGSDGAGDVVILSD